VWLDGLELSSPVLHDQIYVFSTFFYKHLSSGATYVTVIIIICLPLLLSSPQKGYEKVSKWAKCDIFSKKYLIIPINENYHWYLAIVYEPEHVIKSLDCDQQDGEKSTNQSPKYSGSLQ